MKIRLLAAILICVACSCPANSAVDSQFAGDEAEYTAEELGFTVHKASCSDRFGSRYSAFSYVVKCDEGSELHSNPSSEPRTEEAVLRSFTSEELGFSPQLRLESEPAVLDMYRGFVLIQDARHLLSAYDSAHSLFSEDMDRHWYFAPTLTKNRDEIIWTAIKAYYLLGPDDCLKQPDELLVDVLGNPTQPQRYNQYPADLQEIVNTGIISHLPASQYNCGEIIDSMKSYPMPGSILYKAYRQAGEPVSMAESGGLENCILIAFDQEQYGRQQLVIEYMYNGDLSLILPVIPLNIVKIHGVLHPGSELHQASEETDVVEQQ